MAVNLSGGDRAVTLLANTFATVAALIALILAFEPISAHFNPLVSLAGATQRRLAWGDAVWFVPAQIGGAIAGAVCAHAMFGLPLVSPSVQVRTGIGQLLGEFIASFGLVAVIESTLRRRPGAVVAAVAAWIGAAYWCTSSTSFANPAVTIGRSLSDTFVGIRPQDVPGFIVAQMLGGAAAVLVMHGLFATGAPRLAARRRTTPSDEPRVGFRHAQPNREGMRPAPVHPRPHPPRRATTGPRFPESRSHGRPDQRPPVDRPRLDRRGVDRSPMDRGSLDRDAGDRGAEERGDAPQRRRRRRGGRSGDRPRGGRFHSGERTAFQPPPGEESAAPERREFESPPPSDRAGSGEGAPES
jgi:glycerol uptake facilitator-like aquaporin